MRDASLSFFAVEIIPRKAGSLNFQLDLRFLHISKVVLLPSVQSAVGPVYAPLILELFPTEEISKEALNDKSELSFFSFLSALHLRGLLLGLAAFFVFKAVGLIEEYLQYIPYKKAKPWPWYDRALLYSFGNRHANGSHELKYEKEKIKLRIFGWEIVTWFTFAVFSPFAYLTKTNRRREILMVDVFTTEGSLYSGTFSSWVAKEDSFSEISLEYCLRYYPKEVGVLLDESDKSSKKKRKRYLIKNNGEMIISRERIETLHFWEIRKCSCVTVSIANLEDIENAKWFLLLAYVYRNHCATQR